MVRVASTGKQCKDPDRSFGRETRSLKVRGWVGGGGGGVGVVVVVVGGGGGGLQGAGYAWCACYVLPPQPAQLWMPAGPAKRPLEPPSPLRPAAPPLQACYELMQAGYSNVVHLQGGLSSWRYNGYPVESS